MRIRNLWILILIASLTVPFAAQRTRDYAIREIRYEYSQDQRTITVSVVVENLGSAASGVTDVVVLLPNDGNRILIQDTLDPLAAGASVTLQIPLNTVDFPPGSIQTIRVEVALDAFELRNTPIAENNTQSVDVPIPDILSNSLESMIAPYFRVTDDTVFLFGDEISKTEFAIGVVGGLGLVIGLWLLTVILRVLFRRPARFPAWTPPYGMMPMYDQNTIEGRRQAWQQHAESNIILAMPSEGNLHPIKLLTSADGVNLSNWKISAMRLTQYDTYGRITRTQAIAPKNAIHKLNQALRKRHSATPDDQLQKLLRPAAKALVDVFKKQVHKKNGFLPVALDVRFEGQHGEVRIFFELYQCHGNAWYRLDQWEPMMAIVTQGLQENYTFTIHGQSQSETLRDFRNRLREDIVWLLLEMIRLNPSSEPSTPTRSSQPDMREAYDVPDTLAGMQPIREEERATDVPKPL